MEVDVIIPFCREYTSEEKLNEAKESVRNQEISTNIIVQEDDVSPAYGRNKGLEASENRFVAFLDADDRWRKGKLKEQLDRMKDKDKGFSITGVRDISDKDFVKKVFLMRLTGFTSGIVIDTEKVDSRFDENIYRREDHLFALDAVKKGGFAGIKEDYVEVSKHSGGLSNQEDVKKKISAQGEFYDKSVSLWPFLENFQREFWRYVYHRAGRDLYYEGKYKASCEYLKKSLSYKIKLKTVLALILSKYNIKQLT